MRFVLAVVCIAVVAFVASGCDTTMTNPYVMKTDRVDQKLDAGNRGYLKGTPPPAPDRGDLKRPWIAVDVNLPPTTKERAAEAEAASVKEVKREVTVIKEETPTTVKKTTVVTEEETK